MSDRPIDLTESVLRGIQLQLVDLQRAVATLTESQAHTASRALRIEHRLTEMQIETETMIRMEMLGRIGALSHDLDKRFDAIDERFNTVDERFNRVDAHLTGIEGRLDRLEAAGPQAGD